ncbi:pheromone processing endoprotease, partial [Linderina pennispora]
IVAAKDAPNARIEPITGHNSVGKAVERTVLITEQQVADAKMKRVEHVTVSVDIKHDFRGNIEVWLKSPSGIRSQLAAARPRDSDTEGLHGWRFMTVKHWDEEPAGNWTLQVRNAQVQNHSGRLNEWQMTLFGESTEEEPHHTVPTVGGDRKITATETTTVT